MHDDLEPLEPEQGVEWYLDVKESEYAEATIYSHRSRLGHLVRFLDEEDIDNLNDLTGRILHRYRVWRRDEGDLAPPSLKGQMDSVRNFIRWCEKIDAVPQDLSTKVQSPSLASGKHARVELVEVEQAESILDRLRKYEFASARHLTAHLLWRCAFRRGSVVALDLQDYYAEEQYLEVCHWPETETPLKNQHDGERLVAIDEVTCELIDAWIADRRHEVEDEHDRDPLITTSHGRVHPGTLAKWAYSITRPCFTGDDCPHEREIGTCEAAQDSSQAFACPSSQSPHTFRRGALTHWLRSDLPQDFVSSRANVSLEILEEFYDRRSEKTKMNQRRKDLDNL